MEIHGQQHLDLAMYYGEGIKNESVGDDDEVHDDEQYYSIPICGRPCM